MALYSVTVPYTERELGKLSKKFKKDLAIEAEDPIEAMKKAIEHFQGVADNPYASWTIAVNHEKVYAKELQSGEIFRIIKGDLPDDAIDEEEIPFFNEAIFNIDSRERLEVLEKSLSETRDSTSAEEAAGRILKLCHEKMKVEAGSVLLYESKDDRLAFFSTFGPRSEELVEVRIDCGQGIAGYCFDRGQAVVISDAQKDPRFLATLSDRIGFETRSILAVPLYHRRSVIGVMELINRDPHDLFSGNDVLMAQDIADILAIVITAFDDEVKEN